MLLFVSRFPLLGSSHPSTLAITIKQRKRELKLAGTFSASIADFTFISKLVFRFPVVLETTPQ